MEKEGIKWTSELLQEFSEKTGLPLDLIRKMYYAYVDELRKFAKEDETVRINVSLLGSFRYTLHSAILDLKSVNQLKNEEVKAPLLEKFEKRKKIVEEIIKEDLKTKKTSRHFKVKKTIKRIKNS
jgi:hypothetical protein